MKIKAARVIRRQDLNAGKARGLAQPEPEPKPDNLLGKRLDFDIGDGRRNATIIHVRDKGGIVESFLVAYDSYEGADNEDGKPWQQCGGTDTVQCRAEPKHIIYGVIENGSTVVRISQAMLQPVLPQWRLYVKEKKSGYRFIQIVKGLQADIGRIARQMFPQYIGKMELKQVV